MDDDPGIIDDDDELSITIMDDDDPAIIRDDEEPTVIIPEDEEPGIPPLDELATVPEDGAPEELDAPCEEDGMMELPDPTEDDDACPDDEDEEDEEVEEVPWDEAVSALLDVVTFPPSLASGT